MTTVGSSGLPLQTPLVTTPPVAAGVLPQSPDVPAVAPEGPVQPPVSPAIRDAADITVAEAADIEANTTSFPDVQGAAAPSVIGEVDRLDPLATVTATGVTESPIEAGQLEALTAATAAAATTAFSEAEEGTPLHRLGTATSLLQVLNAETLGEDGNQTLADYDQEASEVLGMRRLALEQEVERLIADPTVQSALEQARDQAMTEVFGADADTVVETQAEYLTGEAFRSEIADLPPEEQSARIQSEMATLTALDPERAQEASLALVDTQIREDPQAFLDTMDREETAKALDSLLQDPAWIDQVQGGLTTATQQVTAANDLVQLMANREIRAGVVDGLADIMSNPDYTSATDDGARMAAMRLHLEGIDDPAVRQAASNVLDGLEGSQRLGAGLGHLSRGLAVVGAARRITDGEITAEDTAAVLSSGLNVAANWTDTRNLVGRLVAAAPVESAVRQGARRVATELLGPVADAVMVPFDVIAFDQERQNEDLVGTWSRGISAGAGAVGAVAGVAAGVAIATGSTGVGAPIAAVAAVVSVGAAVADSAFGESDMTGQIRQDLRYLGISDEEESVARSLTTERRTVPGRRPGLTRTVTADLRPDEIRSRAEDASVADRVALINQYVDGFTSDTEENIVAGVIQDAASDPDAFQQIIDNLPMGRIASELDNAEVGDVLATMSRFAENNEVPPGELMGDFLTSLAAEHRQEAINDFLEAVPDEVYQALPADTLRTLTTHLMDGATSGAEEETIVNILRSASPEQLADIFSGPSNASYRRRLSSELSSAQIRRAQGLPPIARTRGRR